MFEYPKNGICVDAECRGNPGIARFQLYDLSSEKITAIGDKFYSTNNIAEFLGLVNAIHYCFKNEIDNLFCDSIRAISWVKKKQYRSNLARNKQAEHTFEKLNKALTWLKTLEFNSYNDSFINSDGQIVFINKWLTSEWGEIPADFGNKN